MGVWRSALATSLLVGVLAMADTIPQEEALPFIRVLDLLPTVRSRVPLEQGSAYAHTPGGQFQKVKVELRATTYDAEVQILRDDKVQTWRGKLFCYNLTSEAPYSWSTWSLNRPLEKFTLVEEENKRSYLAWVSGGSVCFADLSEPRDRTLSLAALFRKGPDPSVKVLPVVQLLPQAQEWGVNALYADIKIVAIERSPGGDYKVHIEGPSGKGYVFRSIRGQWSLESD